MPKKKKKKSIYSMTCLNISISLFITSEEEGSCTPSMTTLKSVTDFAM